MKVSNSSEGFIYLLKDKNYLGGVWHYKSKASYTDAMTKAANKKSEIERQEPGNWRIEVSAKNDLV